jgi:hypothetical protein
MAQRLTLSTAGIKSPLDFGEEETGRAEAIVLEPPPERPAARRRHQKPRAESATSGLASRSPAAQAPFYGTGRPLQTSISFDADCVSQLDELARTAGVSANALAVAALQTGLPVAADAARAMIVDERVNRAGIRAARIERNLRLPEHLRARVDELTFAAQHQVPRATRADLVNAALRAGLPTDAQQAAELVAEHARRVERAAVAA